MLWLSCLLYLCLSQPALTGRPGPAVRMAANAPTGPLRILSVQITAPTTTMVRPIDVLVAVKNDSAATLRDQTVTLTLTPRLPKTGPQAYPPGGKEGDPQPPGLFDPVQMEERIDELFPGRTRTVRFRTPYLAKSGFTTSRGFFTVEDLVYFGQRMIVDVRAEIQPE